MATVTMPQLGESVTEGTIGRWLKQPGDRVAKDEPLVEVITDKVNAEVPSPFAGTLVEILAEEGASVPTGAEIAVVAEEGGEPTIAALAEAPAAAPVPAAAPGGAPAVAAAPVQAPEPAPTPASTPAPTPVLPAAADGLSAVAAPGGIGAAAVTDLVAPTWSTPGEPDARMTPSVRRLLREHGLRPEQVRGSGMGGRITREDVLSVVERARTGVPPVPSVAPGSPAPAVAAATPPPPAPVATRPAIVFPPGADEALVPMTRMRKGIAAQMTRALAVPTAYVQVEVDATNLVRRRVTLKGEYQAREGISLSYVPFVVRAAVEALRRHPTFNAHWTEQGVMAKRRIHVGVAIAVDDGLIVPIVRDADTLSIHGIGQAIADLAARARVGRFRADDFGGATFTVDNTGWYGSNLTLPIVNVPEVAILTMEAITKRAVVVETPDGDAVAIRPVMNMVIGIDHRANDGASAGYFLRDVKAWLEAIGPETAIW